VQGDCGRPVGLEQNSLKAYLLTRAETGNGVSYWRSATVVSADVFKSTGSAHPPHITNVAAAVCRRDQIGDPVAGDKHLLHAFPVFRFAIFYSVGARFSDGAESSAGRAGGITA
jgi:hypothetical protein